MARMSPEDRRDAIVDAALTVARRKGLASVTVRDVAHEMGTSSGLIHHYFETMDDVLAAAFERVAGEELAETEAILAEAGSPIAVLAGFLDSYAPVGEDWSFQLWLDAWAEAARRPALRQASSRLNLALGRPPRARDPGRRRGGHVPVRTTRPARRGGSCRSSTASRSRSSPTGRSSTAPHMLAWAATAAERELSLPAGSLEGRRDERGYATSRLIVSEARTTKNRAIPPRTARSVWTAVELRSEPLSMTSRRPSTA